MRTLAYIIMFLLPLSMVGQESAWAKKTAANFKTYYNENNAEGLYNSLDSVMQANLPIPKIEEFYAALMTQFGKITSLEFSKNVANNYYYKTSFERGVLSLLLAVLPDEIIYGFTLKPYIPENLPVLERNVSPMQLPFNEEWTVVWGGETIEQNYHVAYSNQKYAYDILIVKDNASYSGDAKVLENYYVFGKDVIAPCDATVVEIIKGVKDNIPGEMNPAEVTGNTVILKTDKEEFILMAHLKQNSIVVKEGQQVKVGDLLGQCGNSGNSSEPHLHLSLQNVQDMSIATGAKLYFNKIIVNGEEKTEYIPVKNDVIKNK